jgi:hypothetical protein
MKEKPVVPYSPFTFVYIEYFPPFMINFMWQYKLAPILNYCSIQNKSFTAD